MFKRVKRRNGKHKTQVNRGTRDPWRFIVEEVTETREVTRREQKSVQEQKSQNCEVGLVVVRGSKEGGSDR